MDSCKLNWRGFAEGVVQILFTVLWFKWSPQNTVQLRFYLQFKRYFHMKIIVTIIPTCLIWNSLLPFLCFLKNQKKRIKFWVNLWSGNEKCFCFFYKGMLNSIDFYQGIFLLAILFVLYFHDIHCLVFDYTLFFIRTSKIGP